jgi:hypothetical protein
MAEVVNKLAFADFYNGTMRNETKSIAAGRPIFDDVEMIRIRWAGNTKNEFHAPASDRSDRPVLDPETNTKWWPTWREHPDFRQAYEAFKLGAAVSGNGTPLEEWPTLTAAKRAELKAINIMTVDQLANLGPDGMKRLGIEGPSLKEQAKLYLDRAAGAAVDARHASEMDEMRRQMDELRAMLAGGQEAAPAKATRAAKSKAVAEPDADVTSSPFYAMDDESIRLWCKEADPNGEQPHHLLKHPKLVAFADALNARIKAERTKAA